MFARVVPIVMGCTSMEEAAMRINDELFDVVGVHYNTGRKRPNAAPSESIAQGRATCTGLTILMVDACRAAGIPARAAGVSRWHDDRGNHTWVEVWDDGRWHSVEAFGGPGYGEAWWIDRATRADASDPQYAVWATSWKPTGSNFPLEWDPADHTIPAVNVTERYLAP